jgi:gamma-glutamylcyclotransferase (GGCT)/AIG2-like uncharacterized protein YtfP
MTSRKRADPEDDSTLYFAYGSNMDLAQMQRAPDAIPLEPAVLRGYRFLINRAGWATVVPAPGGIVRGLLWNVSDRTMAALDSYEGVDEGLYTRSSVEVERGSAVERALIYLAADATPGTARRAYIASIIAAARAIEAPEDYLAELEEFIVHGS